MEERNEMYTHEESEIEQSMRANRCMKCNMGSEL